MAEEIINNKVNESKPWNLFISWHDDKEGKSKAIALELKEFINFVVPDINVFCSASISSGEWSPKVDIAFKECTFAIFLLMDDAIRSHWVTFECGAFYMKALYSAGSDKERDSLMDNYVVYDIKKSASGVSSPIKKLQVVAITSQSLVKDYFKRLAAFSGDCGYETRFDDNWETFQDNRRGFYDDVTIYKRKPYVDGVTNVGVPDFNELPKLFFDAPAQDSYVHRDIVKSIKTRLDSNQFVNLVGMGGCGKTTITYNFVNSYRDCYSLCTGKVINGDFYKEFNEYFANKFNIPYQNNRDEKYSEQIFKQILLVLKKYRRSEERKFNLFVLDINEDSNYVQISEAVSALKQLEDWRFLVVSREKIEVLEGNQIDLCKIAQSEKDFDFLNQVLFHYIKERKSFYERHFDNEKLGNLFKKFGYLPLLVEQLAYYLDSDEFPKPQTYDDLMELLGDDVLHSDLADTEMNRKDKYQIVGKFLSKLMDFHKRLTSVQKNIAKYFMLWPAEYYAPDFILKMSGADFGGKFTTELGRLCDKCILDRSTDEDECFAYKMHGLIASSFRDQVFTKDENKEYRDFVAYTDHLSELLESEDLDEMSLNCIKFSLSHFASFDVKYLLDKASIISKKHVFFWLIADKTDVDGAFNSGATAISENALKIRILQLENQDMSQSDIYKKIVGYCTEDGHNVASMPPADIYYKSLNRSERELPGEQLDDFGSFINIPVEGVNVKMRKVVGGLYQMGSVSDPRNMPHTVTVGDFYIGTTQVTQELWDAVMKKSVFQNPSNFNECKDNPVEMVSWYDCLNFIIELNELTGLHFWLPTEEQWEYAAGWRKDGERNRFSGCNDENELKNYAWFRDHFDNKTHRVGCDVLPNDLGIFDMSGNVNEWCQDLYNSSGESRILRGGSFLDFADSCRVSFRNYSAPVNRDPAFGLRLVLTSPKKEEK